MAENHLRVTPTRVSPRPPAAPSSSRLAPIESAEGGGSRSKATKEGSIK